MEKVIYIVHCIDTEGPLFESLEDTFNRVEDVFRVKLNATHQNLKKLQNGSIDLAGQENAVAKMDEKTVGLNQKKQKN